jgi:hypothetical protein
MGSALNGDSSALINLLNSGGSPKLQPAFTGVDDAAAVAATARLFLIAITELVYYFDRPAPVQQQLQPSSVPAPHYDNNNVPYYDQYVAGVTGWADNNGRFYPTEADLLKATGGVSGTGGGFMLIPSGNAPAGFPEVPAAFVTCVDNNCGGQNAANPFSALGAILNGEQPLLLNYIPTTYTLQQIRSMPQPDAWQAAELYVQESYGSAGQQYFPVPAGQFNGEEIAGSGGRYVDAPVIASSGDILANEVKMYQ